MTFNYATLTPELTAAQAIENLREVASDRETIYYAFVSGERGQLLGFVSLKNLILSSHTSRVDEVMYSDFIFARVNDDQEDAARKIQKYDLLALPVVDEKDALVGIITHDDAIDIITQEYTEDMEILMAIVGTHEDAVYMKTTVWGHLETGIPG